MATWKKVIVSGSQAELATLKVDNLTDQQVVIGGGSAANLSTRAINGTGNILATTGSTGVSMSGSFSGSISATSLRASLTQLATPNYVSFDLATNTLYYNLTSSFGVSIVGGALATGNGSVVSVNTSSLVTNQIPKYNNNTLSGSNISDTGTQVQIAAGATSGLSVAAGGVTVTGNSTFNNNLTVVGDLTVAGTASFQNTQNLLIADRFAALASGSNTPTDGGIIIVSSTGTGPMSGSAFYLEATTDASPNYGRFAVAPNVAVNSSTVTADEWMVSTKLSTSVPSAAPVWGGATQGVGNMWIKTDTGDIYIYS